jgi:hypothetical protein
MFQQRAPVPVQLRVPSRLRRWHGGSEGVRARGPGAGDDVVAKRVAEAPLDAQLAKEELKVVEKIGPAPAA